MKIVILTLGFVFLAAGQANPGDKDLINRINAVKRHIKSITSEIKSVKNTELPKLSQRILRRAKSNKFVIQAQEQLKNNVGKESTKKCQELFDTNLDSTVDQIYLRVSDRLTLRLTKADKDLRKINLKLDDLKYQLESGSDNIGRIEREIIESAKAVNRLRVTVPILVPTALDVVKKNSLPRLAKEKILDPVTDCLANANPDDQ